MRQWNWFCNDDSEAQLRPLWPFHGDGGDDGGDGDDGDGGVGLGLGLAVAVLGHPVVVVVVVVVDAAAAALLLWRKCCFDKMFCYWLMSLCRDRSCIVRKGGH